MFLSVPQQTRAFLHLYISLHENRFHLAQETQGIKPLQQEGILLV